jgi:spoIIIJ-associated protein
MNSVEVVGRTVEEAVAEALSKLQASRDEVNITVLDEGAKGLFGIIGSKQAKVLVEMIPTHERKLARTLAFLRELLAKMGVEAEVNGTADAETINVEITGDDLGVLIGRRGQTLDALQYLAGLSVNRQAGEDWHRIVIDVEGYRARRTETLQNLAQRLAAKAQATGRRVILDPMNAAERRIVHQELSEIDGVETHSEGKEPCRKVVIVPKK